MFFIPKTTNDSELAAKVCEALSFYIEIIRQSAQMDFTFAYSNTFSPYPNLITQCRPGDTLNGNNKGIII